VSGSHLESPKFSLRILEGRHRQFFAIVDLLNNPLAFQALRSDRWDGRAEAWHQGEQL
jgi:hypothetical protein